LTERARSHAAAETERHAAAFAARLRPGDLVVLSGELGTGKTTWVRGACRALGVEGRVTSPTFTVGRRYRARIPVSHVDLHRLGGLAGEDPSLLAEYFAPDVIAFVEWGELGEGDLPPAAWRVRLAHAGGDARDIEVEG
jgi:tRNA threonylcarbamoyladenosine biosynthesis protein TsaE